MVPRRQELAATTYCTLGAPQSTSSRVPKKLACPVSAVVVLISSLLDFLIFFHEWSSDYPFLLAQMTHRSKELVLAPDRLRQFAKENKKAP